MIETSVKESTICGAGNGRFFENNYKKDTIVRKQEYNSEELRILRNEFELREFDITYIQKYGHSAPVNSEYDCIFLNNPPMFTNHSSSPNIYFIYGDNFKYTLTSRDVERGEEMLQDYGEYKIIDWYETYINNNNAKSLASFGREINRETICNY